MACESGLRTGAAPRRRTRTTAHLRLMQGGGEFGPIGMVAGPRGVLQVDDDDDAATEDAIDAWIAGQLGHPWDWCEVEFSDDGGLSFRDWYVIELVDLN